MKALLTLIIFGFGSLIIHSQEIEIYAYETDTTDISGTTIVALPGTGFKKFSIRNRTESDFEFRIERLKIMEEDGVEDFLAFGQSDVIADGFPPDTVSPENPFITPISHTLTTDVLGYLGCHYINDSNVGCSQYRYYILNDADERLDSIDVKFCLTVSVPENKEVELTVFPNPVSNVLNLSGLGINPADYNLVIYDLLGQQVYVHTGIPNQINCGFLGAGVYSVLWVDPSTNAVLFSKKIIKK